VWAENRQPDDHGLDSDLSYGAGGELWKGVCVECNKSRRHFTPACCDTRFHAETPA
jgi:hypothetical protein